MKRIVLVVAVLLAFGASAALAANPEPFNVKITVRQAITIAKVTDLDFGAVDNGAATWTVSPDAGPYSAGIGAIAASFTVQGESGQTAVVSFGSNPVSITNGTDTLSVTLTLDSSLGTPISFNGLPQTYYVGGSVTLAGGESSGLYTGLSPATLSMVYQ
jgi:spore coat protein U-like protein